MIMNLNAKQQLRNISPLDINPNPENPRIVFRQDEMESLMVSINAYGIQVPITVYKDHSAYVLIDGERRWRCAKKLNLKIIPAIIQDKPDELDNLVLMYNIHALREQWDYFTISYKIERMSNLYEKKSGKQPTEMKLSELTGLTRGAIRRCYSLIRLPEHFKVLLLKELEKPKSLQRLNEDFFIEMEKALKAVTRRMGDYEPHINEIRDTLVSKYQNHTIAAVTDFRQLSKIATSIDGLNVPKKVAVAALDKIFDPSSSATIRQVYSETVEFEYAEKKIMRQIDAVRLFINSIIEEENQDILADDVKKVIDLLINDLNYFKRLVG